MQGENAQIDGTGTEARRHGRVTFRLAAVRGFCYGVERAIRIAQETLAFYAGRRVFITNPILHHPQINQDLRSQGVIFLSESPQYWDEVGR